MKKYGVSLLFNLVISVSLRRPAQYDNTSTAMIFVGTSRLECVSPETFTLTGARQTEPEPISRSHDIFSKTKRQRLVTKADLDRATSIVSNTSAISINQTNGSATRDDFHDCKSM